MGKFMKNIEKYAKSPKAKISKRFKRWGAKH